MRNSIREKLNALAESERSYRGMFENTEVSIWNEDLSLVYAELERLRSSGVENLQDYLQERGQHSEWRVLASVEAPVFE